MGAELSAKATVEDLLASMKQLTKDSVSELKKEIREIDMLISKVRSEMQEMAKLNYDCSQGMRALAKAIVLGEKGKREISLQIVNITNLERELRIQATNAKVHALLKEATPVMEMINNTFMSSGFKEGMFNMAKELHKMGVIGDVLGTQLDSVLDTADGNEDQEVNKVINQILQSEQAKAGALPTMVQGNETIEGSSVTTAAAATTGNNDLDRVMERLSAM